MIIKNDYQLNEQQYIDSYKKMLLLRKFEEKCGQLYGMNEISGFCHLYIGQEAIIVGTNLVKEKDDCTITSYRDHAHIILAGTDVKYVLAELLGKSTGCSKGRGGSMHMFDIENKFYGGHGIVGAQVSIGTGIAFKEKYFNSKNICYTFLGDGAINQGQVYESFNMAALWKLPIVYIIENNKYSMGTSLERSTYVTDLYKKGESFGIIGCTASGMSINEVFNALSYVTNYTREGNGPIILELKTYRYRGHSMSDPAKYRSKEELEYYKKLDPINEVKEILLKNCYLKENEIKAIDTEVKSIIEDAVIFARNSNFPDESDLLNDLYTK